MNLIYMCVFHQESYIHLLKLLIESISIKGNINKKTTDILIITSPSFYPIIQKELSEYNLPLLYHILDLHTLMESSCCKLKIFNYDAIDNYSKILYLDTDVLVNSDVNVLFNIEISAEKLHALEEGVIGDDFWGGMFFSSSNYILTIPAYSAGVFYFMNSPSMKILFKAVNAHIDHYMLTNTTEPECLDQPFLVYNSFIQNKYDNQLMKPYLENNPTVLTAEKIIYHFPGGPGQFTSKYVKMSNAWNVMKLVEPTRFDTRNEMLRTYCSKLTNPRLLEIGVFRGEFLEYLVTNCAIGSIDAVDLFEGVTCSGNVDGNDLVHYNIGKSYLELSEKYKGSSTVKLYKSDSGSFLQSQPDSTYDIIYIDGDHSYSGVKNDLINAYSKIKKNGYIMGHDYEMNMNKAKNVYNFGVKDAVDEFCSVYNQTILAKAFDGCVSYCIQIKK